MDAFITLPLDYPHDDILFFNTLGDAVSLKTLLGKLSGTKPQLREKEYIHCVYYGYVTPPQFYLYVLMMLNPIFCDNCLTFGVVFFDLGVVVYIVFLQYSLSFS